MHWITQLTVESRLISLKKELEHRKAQRVALKWLDEFSVEDSALAIQMQARPETVWDDTWEWVPIQDN